MPVHLGCLEMMTAGDGWLQLCVLRYKSLNAGSGNNQTRPMQANPGIATIVVAFQWSRYSAYRAPSTNMPATVPMMPTMTAIVVAVARHFVGKISDIRVEFSTSNPNMEAANIIQDITVKAPPSVL
uniref:Uncharacterized protein n=1 Tax=Lotharella oceanica TaxID=641309 RepID=A0A7S2X804_9EUKA|mmetsp:Transcript_12193/g.23455  ORF Transcript_12193/g.23455 Transcript_12193/m.23455 type:complete len:126 (+) Transcript_12193:142-519(+)